MLVSGSGKVRVQRPLWPRENGENIVNATALAQDDSRYNASVNKHRG